MLRPFTQTGTAWSDTSGQRYFAIDGTVAAPSGVTIFAGVEVVEPAEGIAFGDGSRFQITAFDGSDCTATLGSQSLGPVFGSPLGGGVAVIPLTDFPEVQSFLVSFVGDATLAATSVCVNLRVGTPTTISLTLDPPAPTLGGEVTLTALFTSTLSYVSPSVPHVQFERCVVPGAQSGECTHGVWQELDSPIRTGGGTSWTFSLQTIVENQAGRHCYQAIFVGDSERLPTQDVQCFSVFGTEAVAFAPFVLAPGDAPDRVGDVGGEVESADVSVRFPLDSTLDLSALYSLMIEVQGVDDLTVIATGSVGVSFGCGTDPGAPYGLNDLGQKLVAETPANSGDIVFAQLHYSGDAVYAPDSICVAYVPVVATSVTGEVTPLPARVGSTVSVSGTVVAGALVGGAGPSGEVSISVCRPGGVETCAPEGDFDETLDTTTLTGADGELTSEIAVQALSVGDPGTHCVQWTFTGERYQDAVSVVCFEVFDNQPVTLSPFLIDGDDNRSTLGAAPAYPDVIVVPPGDDYRTGVTITGVDAPLPTGEVVFQRYDVGGCDVGGAPLALPPVMLSDGEAISAEVLTFLAGDGSVLVTYAGDEIYGPDEVCVDILTRYPTVITIEELGVPFGLDQALKIKALMSSTVSSESAPDITVQWKRCFLRAGDLGDCASADWDAEDSITAVPQTTDPTTWVIDLDTQTADDAGRLCFRAVFGGDELLQTVSSDPVCVEVRRAGTLLPFAQEQEVGGPIYESTVPGVDDRLVLPFPGGPAYEVGGAVVPLAEGPVPTGTLTIRAGCGDAAGMIDDLDGMGRAAPSAFAADTFGPYEIGLSYSGDGVYLAQDICVIYLAQIPTSVEDIRISSPRYVGEAVIATADMVAMAMLAGEAFAGLVIIERCEPSMDASCAIDGAFPVLVEERVIDTDVAAVEVGVNVVPNVVGTHCVRWTFTGHALAGAGDLPLFLSAKRSECFVVGTRPVMIPTPSPTASPTPSVSASPSALPSGDPEVGDARVMVTGPEATESELGVSDLVPVAGACLLILRNDAVMAPETCTDADGIAIFVALPAGIAELEVTRVPAMYALPTGRLAVEIVGGEMIDVGVVLELEQIAPSPSPTASPDPVPTPTPSPTEAPSPSPDPTISPSPTGSPVPSPSPSAAPTAVPSSPDLVTPTPSADPWPPRTNVEALPDTGGGMIARGQGAWLWLVGIALAIMALAVGGTWPRPARR